MAKRENDHQSISDVLKAFVSDHKLQPGLDKVEIKNAWEQVMGPAITKYTHAIKLERGTLHIQLTSSVLREELSYGKEKIIANINESLGRELVSKLILR